MRTSLTPVGGILRQRYNNFPACVQMKVHITLTTLPINTLVTEGDIELNTLSVGIPTAMKRLFHVASDGKVCCLFYSNPHPHSEIEVPSFPSDWIAASPLLSLASPYPTGCRGGCGGGGVRPVT